MTPSEARAVAKRMIRELWKVAPRLPSHADNPEFFERAAVLADVVLQTARPDVGEALALAVRGRVTPYSGRFDRMGAGAQLPAGTEASELLNALFQAGNILFPPRRSPCMPNPTELRKLVENEHGRGPEAQRALRRLNAALRETCGHSSHPESAMEIANEVLGGHGIERAAYEVTTRRGEMGRPVDFYYVNMGDTYAATLIAARGSDRFYSRRFHISTWGDEVERAERRYGEGGMWRV